jgi:hypothetical protein
VSDEPGFGTETRSTVDAEELQRRGIPVTKGVLPPRQAENPGDPTTWSRETLLQAIIGQKERADAATSEVERLREAFLTLSEAVEVETEKALQLETEDRHSEPHPGHGWMSENYPWCQHCGIRPTRSEHAIHALKRLSIARSALDKGAP